MPVEDILNERPSGNEDDILRVPGSAAEAFGAEPPPEANHTRAEETAANRREPVFDASDTGSGDSNEGLQTAASVASIVSAATSFL